MVTWTRRRSWAAGGEVGAATIEFVFLGILLLIPLLYLVIAVFQVQRNAFAVTQAAREAGRAFASASDAASGRARAEYAMGLALRDQGLDPKGTRLEFGPTGSRCAPTMTPTLVAGSNFEVCVVRRFRIPAVPAFFDGGNNTVTGRYVIHVDNFRSDR